MKKIFLLLFVLLFVGIVVYLGFNYERFFLEKSNAEKKENLDKNEEKIDELKVMIEGMTLEEKVGQMFMVRVPLENAQEMVSKYHLGGYILFARDFEGKTKEEAKKIIDIFLKMIRREEVTEEQLEKLGDARALQNISNMPARVKCAELAWYTMQKIL